MMLICGDSQAAKARGCNPLIPGCKSQSPLIIINKNKNKSLKNKMSEILWISEHAQKPLVFDISNLSVSTFLFRKKKNAQKKKLLKENQDGT